LGSEDTLIFAYAILAHSVSDDWFSLSSLLLYHTGVKRLEGQIFTEFTGFSDNYW
jgi:hypothetical protein